MNETREQAIKRYNESEPKLIHYTGSKGIMRIEDMNNGYLMNAIRKIERIGEDDLAYGALCAEAHKRGLE